MYNPWFKFQAVEWLTGNIRFLSAEEQGVFITICALVWKSGGSYEIDTFTHRQCNTSEQVFNTCLQVLTDHGFVLNNDGKLSVDFINEQIKSINDERVKKSIAGKKSAEKRASIQQVSTNKEIRKKKEEIRKKNIEYTPQFEELWRLYGLKGSKKVSFNQWNKLTEVEKDDAAKGIAPYLQETPDNRRLER